MDRSTCPSPEASRSTISINITTAWIRSSMGEGYPMVPMARGGSADGVWASNGTTSQDGPGGGFRKILWRSSEEGPPHWDEVEAATDLPEHTFEEEFASAELDPRELSPGCLSVLLGISSMFFGTCLTMNYFLETPDKRDLVQTG